MSATPPSPRYSLRGWTLQTWAVKNAKFVKDLVSTAAGLTGTVAVTDLPAVKAAAIVWGAVALIIGFRLGADVVHYFFAENPA